MENKMLIKQYNGLYCIYSIITKSLIEVNMTRKKFIDFCLSNKATVEYAENILNHAYSFIDIVNITSKLNTYKYNKGYKINFGCNKI